MPSATDVRAHEVLADCIARQTANGVDLAAYNNVGNAADVNDLPAALGYERIAFYGTLLGQFVMRDSPEILELVVFDSTDALSAHSWIENHSIGPWRSCVWRGSGDMPECLVIR